MGAARVNSPVLAHTAGVCMHDVAAAGAGNGLLRCAAARRGIYGPLGGSGVTMLRRLPVAGRGSR